MPSPDFSPFDAAQRGMPHEQDFYPSPPVFSQMHRSSRSNCGNIQVLSYSPAHGNQGTRIQAIFTCKGDIGLDVRIRLVVGTLRVSTNVDESEQTSPDSWKMDASVPAFNRARWSSPTVPLTIEAIDNNNQVLDWVRFGDFTYGDAVLEESLVRQDLTIQGHSPSTPTSSLRLVTGIGSPDRSSKRKSPHSFPPTPISDSEYASSSSSSQPRSRRSPGQPHTVPHVPSLRRTRQALERTEQNTQTAVLDILTPLDGFCHKWDESELQTGRRLIRFRRIQDRNSLMVSAEHISQAEYDPSDIVVSCIYREETESFCVTSVDIIHLLQRLVDTEFEVDEKNRIRRNLEGLRPTTVSKSRPGFESFFQKIMDFPDPKPRKIEKDLKVFDWKLLPQALEKIISKYSMYTSSSSASPRSRENGLIPLQNDPPNGQVVAKAEPLEYFPLYSDSGAFPSVTPTCHDAELEVSQLSHLSPITQLSPFPATDPISTDPGQAPHLYPLAEEAFSPVAVDPAILKGYLDGDMVYDIHPSSHVLCSADTSINHPPSFGQTEQTQDWVVPLQQHNHHDDMMLALTVSGSSVFGSRPSIDQGHNYPSRGPVPAHPLAHGHPHLQLYSATHSQMQMSDYAFAEANEMTNLYTPVAYAANPYVPFELQTLREHNDDANNGGINERMNNGMGTNAAALAGQVAF